MSANECLMHKKCLMHRLRLTHQRELTVGYDYDCEHGDVGIWVQSSYTLMRWLTTDDARAIAHALLDAAEGFDRHNAKTSLK